IPAAITRELSAIANADATAAPIAIARAIAGERARTEQVPPAFSAIQVDGQRAYDRARRGLETELAPRAVEVHTLEIRGANATDGTLDLELEVTKGYYVRSLAHAIGERLGVPAHLGALRRIASGRFTLEDAATLDDPEGMRARLVPIAAAAAAAMPI